MAEQQKIPEKKEIGPLNKSGTESPPKVKAGRFKLVVDNSPETLPQIRALVTETLKKTRLSKQDIDDVILCIDEALANAIRYGQSMDKENNAITFCWWSDKQKVYFEITDNGTGFEPDLDNWKPPNTDTEKGRGIWIMKQLLSDVKFQDTGSGTRVTLVKSFTE